MAKLYYNIAVYTMCPVQNHKMLTRDTQRKRKSLNFVLYLQNYNLNLILFSVSKCLGILNIENQKMVKKY